MSDNTKQEQQQDILTYNGKPIDIKLTFALRFKLISMGLNVASPFITDGASIVDFCKAWSLLLNEPFDATSENMEAETERFLKGFSMLEAVNPYYLLVLHRDNQTDSEAEEIDDKKKATLVK